MMSSEIVKSSDETRSFNHHTFDFGKWVSADTPVFYLQYDIRLKNGTEYKKCLFVEGQGWGREVGLDDVIYYPAEDVEEIALSQPIYNNHHYKMMMGLGSLQVVKSEGKEHLLLPGDKAEDYIPKHLKIHILELYAPDKRAKRPTDDEGLVSKMSSNMGYLVPITREGEENMCFENVFAVELSGKHSIGALKLVKQSAAKLSIRVAVKYVAHVLAFTSRSPFSNVVDLVIPAEVIEVTVNDQGRLSHVDWNDYVKKHKFHVRMRFAPVFGPWPGGEPIATSVPETVEENLEVSE